MSESYKHLRIAQLANFVGPESGGMRTAINNIGEGYQAAGAERILVVPGRRDGFEETEHGMVVYVRAPRLPVKSNGYRMITAPSRALRVLDHFRPTSVEISDKWTLAPIASWASARGIGSMLFSHERLDTMASLWLRGSVNISAWVEHRNRTLGRRFDRVVVTSDFAAQEFAEDGVQVTKVPLGVDLELFHPSKGHPADDGLLKLVYVGRMSREKSPQLGVDVALELHRRGVPFRLDMYGSGPDLEELKEQAGDAPVVFHGYQKDRELIARRYAEADVSFSVCPVETFGLAALEALASGTPILTADTGGAHELVDETCGASARPEPVAMTDALLALVERPRDQVRAAARARAEAYPWSTTVSRMLALHEQLAHDAPYAAIRRGILRRRRPQEWMDAWQRDLE
ncbi:alpha-1,6-mannosyltransferase [Raineyella antarctica]|uniref:Alpha-1,6-mannosyltransferase n=1 Tax=Raineyella antarctica TaxID=1577474 RepID=A0A1G6I0V2_9ACTN|nr:alpha-1,6-mannosyltransferase [Raineyella antarctica]